MDTPRGPTSSAHDAAERFIAALRAPATARTYAAKGMELPSAVSNE